MARYKAQTDTLRKHKKFSINQWYSIYLLPEDGKEYMVDILWKAYDPETDSFVYGRTPEERISQYSLKDIVGQSQASGQKIVAFLFTGPLLTPGYVPTVNINHEEVENGIGQ